VGRFSQVRTLAIWRWLADIRQATQNVRQVAVEIEGAAADAIEATKVALDAAQLARQQLVSASDAELDQRRFEALLALLQQRMEVLQARTQSEHIYATASMTASVALAVGAGAVSGWSVPRGDHFLGLWPVWLSLSLVAALGILGVLVTAIKRINRTHLSYMQTLEEIVLLAEEVRQSSQLDERHVLAAIRRSTLQDPHDGYKRSRWVAIAGAVASIAFCMTLLGRDLAPTSTTSRGEVTGSSPSPPSSNPTALPTVTGGAEPR
jgi:hypothetical protein